MNAGDNFDCEPPDIGQLSLLINSDIVDKMFSMRDALSALPPELPAEKLEGDTQVNKRKARDTIYSHFMPLTIELKAPTSPATLLNDDSLTYLNQDQSYTIQLSDYGEEQTHIKSIVRICFYEERMHVTEARHLAFWQAAHIGERMLDIALDDCIGCDRVYADPDHVNALVCIWQSSSRCCISFKAHCVSTEFTAKKHGGEKGVPFTLQVDSFRVDDNSHICSAACQVKVFKPKGADRKNRTDREKLEKRNPSEKLLYRTATPTTSLEEVSYCPMSRLAIDDSLQQTLTDQNLLAALDDFLSPSSTIASASAAQYTCTPDVTTRPSAGIASSVFQGKRPAQFVDCGLATGVGGRPLASAVVLPMQTHDGRLFRAENNENSVISLCGEHNVDALPFFSQCEISEQSPISSRLAVLTTTAVATNAISCPKPPPTNPNGTPEFVFKQPRCLPSGSQKRSTSLRADSVLGGRVVEWPCGGCCSACGRACWTLDSHGGGGGGGGGGFSVEWSAKRQRRRKHISDDQKQRRASPTSSSTHQLPASPHVTPGPPPDPHGVEDHLQPRRPSTSSENSQQVPSDKSSLLPGTSHTKSDPDEDFPEEEEQQEPEGEEEEEEEEEDEEEEEEDQAVEGDADEESEGGAVSAATPRRYPAGLSSGCRKAFSGGGGSAQVATTAVTLTSGTRRSVRTFKSDMSRAAVANWLRSAGFSSLRSKFAKFTGSDMLRLNRRDLILLCGTVEGIRLSNAILLKPPRATCTIYVRQDPESIFQAIYLYQQTESELRIRLASSMKLHSSKHVSLVLKTTQDIDVAVTDEVVSYFEDQNSFTIRISEQAAHDKVTIYLKKL